MDDDLTPFFLHAIERRGQWSAEMFPRALEIITGLLGLAQAGEPGTITIDWNRDSAERWGRVLYDRYAVTIGRIDMPLFIMLDAYTSVLQSQLEGAGIVAVGVENFETRQYHLDPGAVQQAYPEFVWRTDAVTPDYLSSIDLWWSTL